MPHSALISAIESVPAGAWGVGVSGGADSVALLLLLRSRPDLTLHVVHLHHQTRGEENDLDAAFVLALADRLNVSCTIAFRSEVEATLGNLPANLSSRYRAARIELFRRIVAERKLAGVVLAHHADDQAETVMLRLLRGSGPMGLAAMAGCANLGELRILRPLLGVSREMLRQFLDESGQPWREDSSNASDNYLRNRIRRLLAGKAGLARDLIMLGESCAALRDWTRRCAPALSPQFSTSDLANLPEILATESARTWLIARGVPPDKITPEVTARLLDMARDAGNAPRAYFPGRIPVMRKGGKIAVRK